MMEVLSLYNYWVSAVLLLIGLYAIISRGNLIKRMIGLNIFQAAVFLLYISMNKMEGGTAPILVPGEVGGVFSNPLPQVLILTAIVVGIATTALGLAVVVRIREEYGSIEDDVIRDMDPDS
jgi:multicomponent Na+:H+ antiporter subunit C